MNHIKHNREIINYILHEQIKEMEQREVRKNLQEEVDDHLKEYFRGPSSLPRVDIREIVCREDIIGCRHKYEPHFYDQPKNIKEYPKWYFIKLRWRVFNLIYERE